MNEQTTKHLGALERRRAYLHERITEAEADGRPLHFDRAERGALDWVLRKLGGEETQ